MYVRVFSAILDSSIWQEALHVRVLWLTLLIIADESRDGTVNVPISRLAQKASLTEEQTRAAIDILMAPDEESDSPDEDGRRIVPLIPDRPQRGWRLVNWKRYKDISTAEHRREQVKQNVRNHRAKRKADGAGSNEGNRLSSISNPTVTPSDSSSDSDSPSTSSSEESKSLVADAPDKKPSKEKRPKEPKASAKELVESFTVEEKHREWARKSAPSVPVDVECEAWKDRCRQGDPPYTVGKDKPIRDPQAAFYTAMRNAEAWGTYRKGNLFAKHPPTRSVPDEISPQVAKLIGAKR